MVEVIIAIPQSKTAKPTYHRNYIRVIIYQPLTKDVVDVVS